MKKIFILLVTFSFLLLTGCIDDSSSRYISDFNVDVYDPNRSLLTIKYQYEDGTEAAETVRGNIYSPNRYLIRSPKISNHTPDKEYVHVTASGEDTEIVVTYTKDPERCSCCCHRSTYIPVYIYH